jgi:LmbE family N-acetylglucosaminyl deacetylase
MDALAASRRIEGQGTPESRWQAWLADRPLPAVTPGELLAAHWRVVIVAPHPDDEVLAGASLLCHCADAVVPCIVVFVTDGGASHPGSTAWPRPRLVQARAQESRQALALLAPAAQGIDLGIPDGQVREHAAQLDFALNRMLHPRDALFCTWRHDGHPDHEAAGQVCADVARRVGCRFFELPVWAWHWAAPGDPRVPWDRAATLALTPERLALKRQALACFHSQLTPDPSTGRDAILPEWATQRLLRPFEVVFR